MKKTITLGLLVSTLSYGGEWITTDKGCNVWNSQPKPNETVTWSGKCGKDGKVTGEGTVQFYENGEKTSRYEGSCFAGNYEGYGVGFKKDGSIAKQGWFESHSFQFRCYSKKECEAIKKDPCAGLYPGKTGIINVQMVSGWFGASYTDDKYVIRYVNKEHGTVTIEGNAGDNWKYKYGQQTEMSCSTLIAF